MMLGIKNPQDHINIFSFKNKSSNGGNTMIRSANTGISVLLALMEIFWLNWI